MTDEHQVRETLNDAISSIKTVCTFAIGGVANLPLPRLRVERAGSISLPLQESHINFIITASEQAPFRKGAQTVVDTAVRNCRQVDANKVTVGLSWQTAIHQLAVQSATSLGVHSCKVVPRLYKLIVYPPGGFFKPHQDTEKEPAMFATLVIQIPSQFEGGNLIVNHKNDRKFFNLIKKAIPGFIQPLSMATVNTSSKQ
ncbi:hypothetical protein BWQ96_08291 [Gracilariopsis chorda]|uniref:Prolyl 4-hydroxylase alpha subunit Fe(2+) 2OG dioxygenase domain-containing protein n=1 Tax=Gracilariopsis chorda TaxID=448386 RepID=A0A2V3IIR5_9FLOR|nr:hypothetical protein BWQ96_08291 [Gracilariopsis chorda]|eukprot:PXF41984.1 hypothetical protein BWQ96_08291 [Gracilariopsis chorda]